MAGVWVISEDEATLLELLSEGRRMAATLGTTTTAVTARQKAAAEKALASGASEAVLLTLDETTPLEAAAGTLAEQIKAAGADVVLFGATLRGRDLAARVAALLDKSLISGATALRLGADGALETDRLVFGGACVSTQVSSQKPVLVTVPPKLFAAAEPQASAGAVREVAVPAAPTARIKERRPRAASGADITAAKVVVSIGRGLPSQDALKTVEEIARRLGGAVGCSRPVAEDLHWLPEECYVGISGKKIAPQLYLTLGISGQVQHLAGMRDAKVVISINKDENAPIFANADVGLVADLNSALPALAAELGKLL